MGFSEDVCWKACDEKLLDSKNAATVLKQLVTVLHKTLTGRCGNTGPWNSFTRLRTKAAKRSAKSIPSSVNSASCDLSAGTRAVRTNQIGRVPMWMPIKNGNKLFATLP
mmetsp:Transcript_70851/g.196153  ORF Transcript_70851/g.196153 Transcript_70851/m.196153 type:complete len:109 (+) Transcript_70851:605-931(+)